MAVIVTEQLHKTYGRVRALKGVSLSVQPGEIFGLLGQNGAGKTTLIKVLLGVISSTDGRAEVLGEPHSGGHGHRARAVPTPGVGAPRPAETAVRRQALAWGFAYRPSSTEVQQWRK